MNKIKILTGSQCALSAELAYNYNVSQFPYYINYIGKSFREGVDIFPDDFYDTLADINNLPTTSPPSIGDIEEILFSLKNEYNEFIIITLSAKYSQMFNTCQVVQEKNKGLNIYVIDSNGAAGFQGMMVIQGALLIQDNLEIPKILEFANQFNLRSDEFLVFGTLKYLEKGGRIGKVKSLMASALSIKPIVGHRDGISAPIGKVRTDDQALQFIIKQIDKRLAHLKCNQIDILLSGIMKDEWLEYVELIIRKEFNVRNFWYTKLSCVTAIHTGPGVWSLTYYVPEC